MKSINKKRMEKISYKNFIMCEQLNSLPWFTYERVAVSQGFGLLGLYARYRPVVHAPIHCQ